MDYVNVESHLSINAINKILNIKFFEEVFKDENKNALDNDSLKLTISEGKSNIRDYVIKTDDNISFTIFLELDICSDGEQLIFLEGEVFNNSLDKLKINNEIVNLNKEYLYFTGNSLLKTDQNEIQIENIKPHNFSINNQKILEINKGIDISISNLILFKQGCLGENIPSNDILLKNDQKIYFDNKYIEAQEIFFKYNNEIDLELVNYENQILYNVIIDDIDSLEINNLVIKTSKRENSLYIKNYNYGYTSIENIINDKLEKKFSQYDRKITEISKNTNNLDVDRINKNITYIEKINKEINNINNSIIKLYLNREILISLNKKINLLQNKNNNDSKNIINEQKKIDESNEKYNKLIWKHWLKNGFKEKKIMHQKIIFEEADFDRYKDDYKFLTNKLNHSNIRIWKHWLNNGKRENKIMYQKITFENCDMNEYKFKYPNLCRELNYDDEKIWENWLNISKKEDKVMTIKLNYENADFERYKKDYPHLCGRIYKFLK